VGGDVALDVSGAPNVDRVVPVFSARCEEHALIVGHSDAVDWLFVLVKGGDEATLWSMPICRSPVHSQNIL